MTGSQFFIHSGQALLIQVVNEAQTNELHHRAERIGGRHQITHTQGDLSGLIALVGFAAIIMGLIAKTDKELAREKALKGKK